jgi:hypothetical protein
MDERRKLERKNLGFFTRLYDRETGELLGHLANLTGEGAMILCEAPLAVDKDYRLHMEISETRFTRGHLDFTARCIWCRPEDIAPNLYNAGFHFCQIAPADLEVVMQIIEQYNIRGQTSSAFRNPPGEVSPRQS